MLTGGGTGIGLLERVGSAATRSTGRRSHVYWGDERFVPADDDERNDKQAREALLDHVDIPAANVHAMAASDGEFGDDLDAAATGYEQLLQRRRSPSAAARVRRASARHGRRGPRQLAVPATPRRCARPSGWWSGSPTPPSRRRGESR